jgi:predicted phosphodiesterase
MRVAVISDVHANLPALESVLQAVEAAAAEETWCLGDVLGYGAEPDACTDLVRESCDVCLVGNHDLAVLGALDIGTFSEAAAEAVAWTRENVAERTLEYVRGLEPSGERAGIELFHASPRDPIWEYVLSAEQADACLDAQNKRAALIGHSHVALFFTRPAGAGRREVRGAQAGEGTLLTTREGEWLINPGSVGQPRDGDARASYLVLDREIGRVTWHRVAYDFQATADKILKTGVLSEVLARRLALGK